MLIANVHQLAQTPHYTSTYPPQYLIPTQTQTHNSTTVSAFMRKLCPNLDREDGLETVLEVPIPEEMFSSSKHSGVPSWQSMKSWMRSQLDRSAAAPSSMTALLGGRNAELQILLGVTGAPLVPFPVRQDQKPPNQNIKDHPIESSMAKYIVQQYRAAVGGERALDGIDSVYAMGRVKMGTAEFCGGDAGKEMKLKSSRHRGGGGGAGEVGSFVLWQKRPDLWSLELVLSGCKISAGSDGHVAWRQTPWHLPHASRGPPRPLRRSLQGLDPRSTANMFSNSVCAGEKTINEEECFVLKLEADRTALRARSGKNVEMIRHTVWGYFSQRTGLLVQLEDSHLLGIKSNNHHNKIYWETTMESLVQDYKTIDGVNIAHSGRTVVSLVRFGEGNSRTRMEEEWRIEEVDFNIKGLSKECFMAPAELKRDEEEEEEEEGFCSDGVVVGNGGRIPNFRGHVIGGVASKVGGSKVVAVCDESSVEESDTEEDDRL